MGPAMDMGSPLRPNMLLGWVGPQGLRQAQPETRRERCWIQNPEKGRVLVTIATQCPLVDPLQGACSALIKLSGIPRGPSCHQPSVPKPGLRSTTHQWADPSLGLSCLLRKMGIIKIHAWPGYLRPLGKQTRRYVRSLYGTEETPGRDFRTESHGPLGSVSSVVAAPWRQLWAGAGGSRGDQNAPGRPPGHEKAAIQGWLGQEPGDERQEPCALQRKEASAWPPRGAVLPGWEARLPHGEGEAPRRED